MDIKMSKEHILQQYKVAIADFKTAPSEDAQWTARNAMARLERTAIICYGDALLENLQALKEGLV